MSETNMWMVRAGENAYLIDDFKNKNYVAIGWDIGDISKVENKDQVKELVEQTCTYFSKKSQISNAAGQMNRFRFDFKKDDYVISYDPANRIYILGLIRSDYEYNTEISDYYHTRKVDWVGEVRRDDLSTSTRNSLGAITTIFAINDDAAEEIIEILEGKKTHPDEELEEISEEELKEDMVSRAHELIKDKIIALDWEEMEKLVAGVLRSMGYKTLVTERGSDRGKDIEASPDGMMLEEPRILAEVKHRSGKMGAPEVRSFHSVLRGRKGLYISTGGFSKEAKYEADRSIEQLTLIDSDRLVELIIQNYDEFDVETKLLVPLAKIYWPA
ncbi:restriction endonuclease [Methanococcoides alaskense]|uniref:Restriction system protein n=1 Tax=Methanococcoides alaskense TaxID=325778 RepID=A0AA90TX20_9EURY|nr:restriction endonuclease [Methanococcoides alaskense]MDA0525427.1 restriction endonuclease [Methanococcoides alaskense]MDR6221640.1 restriction system protein [Methanococcoides alaskense]